MVFEHPALPSGRLSLSWERNLMGLFIQLIKLLRYGLQISGRSFIGQLIVLKFKKAPGFA